LRPFCFASEPTSEYWYVGQVLACPGPVGAGPAAYACIPHHGVEFLASLQQLLRESLDCHQPGEIDQHALDFHALLQQQADAHCLAIGFSERLLDVRVQADSRVLAFCRIAGRVEDV
jgi:hypothetical protein